MHCEHRLEGSRAAGFFGSDATMAECRGHVCVQQRWALWHTPAPTALWPGQCEPSAGLALF